MEIYEEIKSILSFLKIPTLDEKLTSTHSMSYRDICEENNMQDFILFKARKRKLKSSTLYVIQSSNMSTKG